MIFWDDALIASTPLFVAIAVLLGLLVGSFLNVVIYRLPMMMEQAEQYYCKALLNQTAEDNSEKPVFNLIQPRSRCPNCEHMITAIENIPLLSYLWQRGRCRHCNAKISIQYPIVEIISGVLTGIVAWHFGFGLQAGAAMVLTWALLALSVIDIKHQLLPDSITLPLLWLGLLCALLGIFTDLRSAVIGAMAGYLALWSVFQLFYLLTGKEGMGYGDFKLLALLGAWQGWQSLMTIIIFASLVGSLVGIAGILIAGRDRNIPIPFGPYLAAAGWLALLWGDYLVNLYFDWANLNI